MMLMTAPASTFFPLFQTACAGRLRAPLGASVLWSLVLVLVLMMVPTLPCRAQAESDGGLRSAQTAQVVAGIASYVRWPQLQLQLQLCIVGTTYHAEALTEERLSNASQRITPRTLAAVNAAELAPCQMVYSGKLSEADYRKLLAQVVDRPILTFTEAGLPCDTGSMFCLKARDGQIAFDVNLDAIARSGLRVHPSVLQLARRKPPQ